MRRKIIIDSDPGSSGSISSKIHSGSTAATKNLNPAKAIAEIKKLLALRR